MPEREDAGQGPILVALGANLPHAGRSPRQTLEAALDRLDALGVRTRRLSRWYRTAPVPASDQPDFVNGVAAVETRLAPEALLRVLHRVEAEFGRQRTIRYAARTLDLDLLAYGQILRGEDEGPPILPHPRLDERGFVLVPLSEVAPAWVHPVSGRAIGELLAALPEQAMAAIRAE